MRDVIYGWSPSLKNIPIDLFFYQVALRKEFQEMPTPFYVDSTFSATFHAVIHTLGKEGIEFWIQYQFKYRYRDTRSFQVVHVCTKEKRWLLGAIRGYSNIIRDTFLALFWTPALPPCETFFNFWWLIFRLKLLWNIKCIRKKVSFDAFFSECHVIFNGPFIFEISI